MSNTWSSVVIPGYPWLIRGHPGLSVSYPGSLKVVRGSGGATPELKRGLSLTAPDETRTTPGQHTDYRDELRITHDLHQDDGGLNPD